PAPLPGLPDRCPLRRAGRRGVHTGLLTVGRDCVGSGPTKALVAHPLTWTGGGMADMWTGPGKDPREQLHLGTSEKAPITDYLEAYPATLDMKCEGLTPEQLGTRSVPPSYLSLLGRVQHLARVEHK